MGAKSWREICLKKLRMRFVSLLKVCLFQEVPHKSSQLHFLQSLSPSLNPQWNWLASYPIPQQWISPRSRGNPFGLVGKTGFLIFSHNSQDP